MTDAQKKMIEKLGINQSDFEKKATQEERITALETTSDDIVLMLADIIGGED